ncbi:MAG: hypothetical protein WKG06_13550 [Segetibacter sp.]
MNSVNFTPGDILRKNNFVGAMITHHSDENRNIKMDERSHFLKGFEITFDNSYLVKGRFIKPEEWGTFTKVGQLSF